MDMSTPPPPPLTGVFIFRSDSWLIACVFNVLLLSDTRADARARVSAASSTLR